MKKQNVKIVLKSGAEFIGVLSSISAVLVHVRLEGMPISALFELVRDKVLYRTDGDGNVSFDADKVARIEDMEE